METNILNYTSSFEKMKMHSDFIDVIQRWKKIWWLILLKCYKICKIFALKSIKCFSCSGACFAQELSTMLW